MFLKNALTYSSTNLLSQFFLFIQGIALRRILIPELMGIWNIVNVVRGYVQPITIGVRAGAARELPIIHGAQNSKDEFRYRSVALTYSIAEILLIGLGIITYVLIKSESYKPIEIFAILSVPPLLLASRIYINYFTFLQSKHLFIPLGQILIMGSLLLCILLPAGAFFFGISGIFIGALIAEFLRAFLIIYKARGQDIRASYLWDKPILKRLASQGFRQTSSSYPATLFSSLDLLWITKFLGLEALAIYALSKSLYLNGVDITARMTTVFNTRTLINFGKGISNLEIANEMKNFMQFQLLVTAPLICIGVASFGPFLVRQFIPLYVDCIPLIFILPLCSLFIYQNNNLNTIRIAEKRYLDCGLSNVCGVITVSGSLAVTWYFLHLRSLESIATATLIGTILYSAQVYFSEGRRAWGFVEALKIFLKIIFATVWIAFIFHYLGDRTLAYTSWTTDLLKSAFIAVKMIACFLPIIIFGVWTSNMANVLYQKFIKT